MCDDSDFNFSYEDITEQALKSFQVRLPDLGSKGIPDDDVIFNIKIGVDGIIRSITSSGHLSISSHIFRRNNFLNVKNSWKNPDVTNIKWDDTSVYIRGIAGIYYKNQSDFTQIKITSEHNVVYDYSDERLFKNNGVLYKLVKTGSRMRTIFTNGISYSYYGTGYKHWEIQYNTDKNKINATYFNMDMYPPIEITPININIYSEEEYINIINYCLLGNISDDLQNTLFPLLFLNQPSLKSNNNQWAYDASSFLIEGSTLYWPNNLATIEGLPWASANGYALHENINIDMAGNTQNKLCIVNGFVSKEKPALWKANSRLKEIKLTNLSNHKEKKVLLQDTQEPQTVDIHDLSPGFETIIEIKILSVYEGSKYKDLCVQAIIPIQ
jgi:hypothetical protein